MTVSISAAYGPKGLPGPTGRDMPHRASLRLKATATRLQRMAPVPRPSYFSPREGLTLEPPQTRLRDRLKTGNGRAATLNMLRHVDPTLCERSDRCRVGPHPPTLAAGGTHGAPTPALAAHDPQRHLLPAAHRRCVALPAAGMAPWQTVYHYWREWPLNGAWNGSTPSLASRCGPTFGAHRRARPA